MEKNLSKEKVKDKKNENIEDGEEIKIVNKQKKEKIEQRNSKIIKDREKEKKKKEDSNNSLQNSIRKIEKQTKEIENYNDEKTRK